MEMKDNIVEIFRKATEGDVPNIVKMLADDELGSKREDYKVPLPKSYYDAFQNILQDKNQELIILENFNKDIIGTLQLTFIPYLTYRGGLVTIIFRKELNNFKNRLLIRFGFKSKVKNEIKTYYQLGIVFIIISVVLFIVSITL